MRFYHVFRIGMIRGFYPLLAALVERSSPETHTFLLSVGEVTVTLKDVVHIFGSPIDGEPVNGWVRRIRDVESLDTEESIKRYVRCQIFCLLGSTLFTDRLTAYGHAKYLPLLCDFERIGKSDRHNVLVQQQLEVYLCIFRIGVCHQHELEACNA
ncbi:hypothetical protein Ahy_Scaffold1g107290 [Arachis hypogaea]|uniref:Aminotransferase-like plant mobile domain-containing protein n=1 Tax=Arachis hypogaea TaxID=3818 RepID=A0A444WVA4_ARAHY|nr:hypothetical protein Ahy_Scaffold1g107290 [Arachis hypogaea]